MKYSFSLLGFILFANNITAQNVGIGTTSPNAPFNVAVNKTVLFGDDTTNATGTNKLIWFAKKGALRTGVLSFSDTIGIYSAASGYQAKANNNYSVAFGYSTTAGGNTSTAMGYNTLASGDYSTAIGYGTTASGIYSTASGYNTTASGQYSTTMGRSTFASGYNSTAMGRGTSASGYYSTTLGLSTIASGDTSTAMGYHTTAIGNTSTAMGYNTTASGKYSTAMGNNTIASGEYSTALGDGTTASGQFGSSTAMGSGTTASGNVSIAMGSGTIASGINSTTMGFNTVASGYISTATGAQTIASGDKSTAMGFNASTNFHTQSFCIGGGSNTNNIYPMVANTANNQMMMYFDDYVFYTGTSGQGAELSQNNNFWTSICDKNKKENFEPLNGEEVLNKFSKIDFSSWNYKGLDAKKYRHYGIMAQDFYAAFGKDKYGIIGSDTTVNPIDMIGIDMAAIQALEKRTEKIELLEKENKEIESENAALLARLEKMSVEIKKMHHTAEAAALKRRTKNSDTVKN
jgi:hypothetical protein